ncbi:MAG: methyltransferase domain-containing protein [Halofilum sp. (in: g-proteobacteria)]
MLKPYGGSWFEAQRGLRPWYATGLGSDLHASIAARIKTLLGHQYGLHCLQLGGTQYGADLLSGSALLHRIHVTGDRADSLCAEPSQLPLATNSVDVVVLCHVLEFCDDPHALLREIDRVLKLDGRVLAVGFNPWSLFGLRGLIRRSGPPWNGHFYSPRRIEDWFALLGLHTQRRETLWLRPPVQHAGVRRRLAPCERMGRFMPGIGGIYLLLGRKHSVPFTPLPAKRERAEAVPAGSVIRPTNCGASSCRSR